MALMTRLIQTRRRSAAWRLSRSSRRQCTTMPVCDMVNVKNAPMANSGIKRSVMPSNTVNSSPAVSAR